MLSLKIAYLLLFAGLGVLHPYLPIFYRNAGLDTATIGALLATATTASLLSSALLTALADAAGRHRLVLALSSVSTALMHVLLWALLQFTSPILPLLVLAVVAAAAAKAPVTPLIDSFAIERSAAGDGAYGLQRLWGAVGFGITSLFGGVLATRLGMFANFFSYSAMVFALAPLCAGFTFPSRRAQSKAGDETLLEATEAEEEAGDDAAAPRGGSHVVRAGRVSPFAALWPSLKRGDVMLFLLTAWLAGTGAGVIEAFLFVRLRELGASGWCLGTARLVMCLSEVPLFAHDELIMSKLGVPAVIVVAQLAYVVRFTYYSALRRPWLVVPIEPLHGLTFAAYYAASLRLAHEVSPPEVHTTMQGLLSAVHWGVGYGGGAVIGGILYANIGAVRTFRLLSLLGCLGLVSALLLWRSRRALELQKGQYALATAADDEAGSFQRELVDAFALETSDDEQAVSR